MKITIFNTPIIRHFVCIIGTLFLKCMGWKVVFKEPGESKYIIFVYPHTSNWDFPIGLAAAFQSKLNVQWMGKKSLFRGPAGLLMKWLGGVPIDRTIKNNIVSETIKKFNEIENLKIMIPAEGTRKFQNYIKSGFYYIAMGAKVPIVLGFIDYKTKSVGLGDVIYLSGNITEDLNKIAEFYKDKKGRSIKDAAPFKFRT